ncbi:acyltransferase family protein [Chryseotalea sanaruensis]|uniref:acyltransferase family protein n=1 Tax=Chryseotalea sanaruensis TaxID=2482724 RepID=UPI000F8DD1FE|nr:acyltransferase family protein [Chryseotalea sanaruensis]
MNEISLKPRLYFLDWLRVLAFSLLVFYHAGLIFVDWGFHIQNSHFSEWLKLPMLFVNQWRLPLLFFVSGAGIYFALGNRTAGVFAKERLLRIFIPLVFGMFVVIPPQLYFEWLHHETFTGSYLDFYPLYFSNITWNHLWFLTYLFVFSLLALPLFLYLRSERATVIIASFSSLLIKSRSLILFAIPLFLIEIFLRDQWPDNRNLVSDWYNFAFYFLLLIYGYFFASAKQFWITLENSRRIYLMVGLFSFCIIYFGWHQSGINFLETFALGSYIFDLFKCINIVCWIFCLLGYAKYYLSYNNRSLQYTSKAVYPFYILHQTVLIALGFYVIKTEWSILTKYLIIVMGTFIITMLLYELVVRRVEWIGVFFGVK